MVLKAFRPSFEPLEFPSEDGTKTYTVKPVGLKSASTFLLSLDSESEVTLSPLEQQEIILGPARQEMLDDDATADYMWRVFQTVAADVSRGRAVAEMIWETSGDPKEQAALKARLESLRSNGTDEATETPSPDSTSSTKTSRPSRKRSETAPSSRGTKPSRSNGSS